MKKGVFVILSFLVLILIWAGDSFASDGEDSHGAQINLRITKGLSLCNEFLEILNLPENKGYLMSPEEAKATSKKATPETYIFTVRKIWKPVVIPKRYKNFSEPKWEDVSEEEAYDQLSEFIEWIGVPSRFSLSYPKDYTFQKAFMDIDRDGKADVLYRQNGGDYYLLMGKGESKMHKYFHLLEHDMDREQVLYYKRKPYFLTKFGTTSLHILEPFSARGFLEFGRKDVCDFTTNSLN